jgi:hypothetical protein
MASCTARVTWWSLSSLMVGPFSTGGILDGKEKYALSWRLEFYRRDLVVVARNLAVCGGREPFVEYMRLRGLVVLLS